MTFWKGPIVQKAVDLNTPVTSVVEAVGLEILLTGTGVYTLLVS